jgi:hypothetical protein
MTRGEQNLHVAAWAFATDHDLDLKFKRTTTGLEIEFVERFKAGKSRHFMRYTIGVIEVERYDRLMMDMLKGLWNDAWTKKK